MRNKLSLLLIIPLLSGCFFRDIEADFGMEMDPEIPGKINLTNMSPDGVEYYWQLYVTDEDGGILSTSSRYSRNTSDDENTHFYAKENGWFYVEFTVSGSVKSSTNGRYIEVTNIPDGVVIDSVVVHRVSETDENGWPWNGTANTIDLVSYVEYSSCPASYNVDWDVSIENDFPITLVSMQGDLAVSGLSPQTREYLITIGDALGFPESIFCQNVDGIITERFMAYNYTHASNDGSEDNYPKIIQYNNDFIEADIHVSWTNSETE